MDGKRRGRAGFLNGKLMRWSLYRATTSCTKAKPNQGGYTKMHQTHKNIIVNLQDHQVTPQLLPTHHATSVPYYPPTTDYIANNSAAGSYSATKMDAVYGAIAVDEEIDRKAANYIASVRERFRLGY